MTNPAGRPSRSQRPLTPPPAMTEVESLALGVALARICAQAVGNYRGHLGDLLDELRVRLPYGHPATANEDTAAAAARAANAELVPVGIRVLTGQHDYRVRIRLIPTAQEPAQ